MSNAKDSAYIKQYWQYLKPHKRLLGLSVGLIPVISFLHIVQPLLMKHGIDSNIMTKGLPGLTKTAALLALCISGEFILRATQAYMFQYIGQHSVTEIRKNLFTHVLDFSMTYFDKTPQGTITSRLTSDIESLNDSFASGVVTIVADILTVTGILIAMFMLSVKLTLVTLIVVPPLIIIVQFCQKRLRYHYNNIRSTLGQLNAAIQEQLEGIVIVQLFNRQVKNLGAIKALNREYRRSTTSSVIYDAFLYSFMESLGSVMIAVIIWVGWGQHQGGYLTLGLLVAFIDYIIKFFQPLKEMSNKVAILQHALAALEKIFGTFTIKDAIPKGQTQLPKIKGNIKVNNVSFAYPGHEEKAILNQISFHMPPGKVVAIVGPTGSGKSTINKLITNMYQGYSGDITLDGINVKEIAPQSLGHAISSVTQDVQLFSDTVRFNITMGNDAISDDAIWDALEGVQAQELVKSWKKGLDTVLSNRGMGLSAGQAQLIAFARALAADTPIVFLDEATAAIDSLSEQKIQAAIEVILKKKTVLVIAHRLSTIRMADTILAMKNGRIVESGNHDNLMDQNGFYAKLFRVQFESI